MKKILIMMLLVAFYSFGDSFESFLEYNFEKNYNFKNGAELKKEKVDLSLNFECYSPQEGKVMGGWGFGQISGKVENEGANKINLTPYYLVSKYYVSGKSGNGIFLKLQGGAYLTKTLLGDTNVSGVNIDNGWYYGAGLGGEFKKFVLQLMYREYIGDATINNQDTKFDYDTLTLSFGYVMGV